MLICLVTYGMLLPVGHLAESLRCAAKMHDWGKVDERFQAMLLRGNINAAWARAVPLAKSGDVPLSHEEWRLAAERCGYPKGFRHEMLSVQLAELLHDQLPRDATERELTLHLIAAHHGHGRPFAPVVLDDDPPLVTLEPLDVDARLSPEERRACPPHRLDSGIAERFWTLTRRYGWWGLVYIEAVLRLADQRASQKESESRVASEMVRPKEVLT
jgi:CRISPR-associated endonuclease/helicase Cas3